MTSSMSNNIQIEITDFTNITILVYRIDLFIDVCTFITYAVFNQNNIVACL